MDKYKLKRGLDFVINRYPNASNEEVAKRFKILFTNKAYEE